MLRVLVVDDEPFIRDILKTDITWDSLGMEITGEAHNGIEALKIIRLKKVDIVITDIKMPKMNGIELINEARRIHSALKFVVLSAYDEFNLVSDAFKKGACEYILKFEMTSEKMYDILLKIKLEIEREKENNRKRQQDIAKLVEERKRLKNAAELIVNNKREIRQKFLKSMIWGQGSTVTLETEEMYDLGLRLTPACMKIMVITVESVELDETSEEEKNSRKFQMEILDDIENILNKYNMGDVFCNTDIEYVLIFSCNGTNRGYESEKIYKVIYDDMERLIMQKQKVVVCGGISGTGRGYKSLEKLYSEAKDACCYNFFEKRRNLVWFTTQRCAPQKAIVFDEKIKILKEVLTMMDYNKIIKSIDSLKIKSEEVKADVVKDVKHIFEVYCFYIIDFARQKKIYYKVQDMCEIFYKQINRYGILEEFNKWLEDILMLLAEYIRDGSPLLIRTQYYIQKNYYKNFALSDLADMLGVTGSHLSRTFTQKTGFSITEYVTRLRIEKAKELMQTTNLKIYQIAENVGYTSAEHFSRTFKRITGKSPKQFM